MSQNPNTFDTEPKRTDVAYDSPRNPDGIVSPTKSEQAIIDVFQQAEPCEPFDVSDIAERADMARSTARRHLKNLADEGEITRKKSPHSRWVAYQLRPGQDPRVSIDSEADT
jgi:DNA-binding MarR family transcriptional regulator